MRINVVGRHMDVTDAIYKHVDSKVGKLDKFSDLVQQIEIIFWKESTAGESFMAEVSVDVEHHANFIAKADSHDLYLAIDEAVNKVSRQLNDFREKLKMEHR